MRPVGASGRPWDNNMQWHHRSAQRRSGGSAIAEVGAWSSSSLAKPVSTTASPCSSGSAWMPSSVAITGTIVPLSS